MERVRKALGAIGTDAGGLTHVFREACLDICDAVETQRASIWFFNEAGDAVVCEQLHDCRTGLFQSGQILRQADHPFYFTALRRDGAVRAVDALADPATAEFALSYLLPADIRSMLDHVVFAGPEPVAVLCAEACGALKRWTEEDAAYLSQMAILLGIAIDTRRERYRD